MEQKFRWIDDSIKLDFKMPKIIEELIKEVEQFDLDENYAYFSYIEALDSLAKLLYSEGKMTAHQRELIYRRFRG